MGKKGLIALAVLLCSCAVADMDDDDNNDQTPAPDAQISFGFPDASTSFPDAAPIPDASLPDASLPPDASPQGNGQVGDLCGDHDECSNGLCCFDPLGLGLGTCEVGEVDPIFGLCLAE